MKRFIEDTKKYWAYAIRAGKSDLKSEIATNRLSWLWWILDPLLFMLVYSFVSVIVFHRSEKFLAAFIFVGLSSWNFFRDNVVQSVTLVSKQRSVVSKVYIPKFALIYTRLYVNGFKMLISYFLVIFIMIAYRVPLSYRIVYFIPYMFLLLVVTFGISTIMLNVGVFISDMSNIMNALMRLLFYFSGVFYSITKRVPKPYGNLMLKINPIAYIMDSLRRSLLYSENPDWKWFIISFVFGVLTSIWGVYLIYKNENTYVKVI